MSCGIKLKLFLVNCGRLQMAKCWWHPLESELQQTRCQCCHQALLKWNARRNRNAFMYSTSTTSPIIYFGQVVLNNTLFLKVHGMWLSFWTVCKWTGVDSKLCNSNVMVSVYGKIVEIVLTYYELSFLLTANKFWRLKVSFFPAVFM